MSIRDVSVSCGIGFGTVINYINLAEAAGLEWPLPAEMTDSALDALLFPPKQSKAKTRDVPNWSHIRSELSRKGVTLSLLWKEYDEG